jgi:toxin ParE1/3/4
VTQIIVSPEAEADLSELKARIANAAGDLIATNYCYRIVETIRRLSRIPLAAGRLVPKLGDGMRCHPFGNYNIYMKYDADLNVLYVVRILHGRRDITKKLFQQ